MQMDYCREPKRKVGQNPNLHQRDPGVRGSIQPSRRFGGPDVADASRRNRFYKLLDARSSSQRDAVHWLADPSYTTQVNYRLQSKSLLECRPSIGPDIDIPSGESFQSFRTWMLSYESRDETRQSLALGQMYRTIAPWVVENPLIHTCEVPIRTRSSWRLTSLPMLDLSW